ncbi:lysosomal phospholipase A and acyltransferase-like [Brevipalpus obovatus]|uniref:lysosomal phospholipase A and acyltransferase-like n=1 Tax=Brevipalpus obovatus TaxID=246614 RepID=UPI003D9E21D9
MILFVSLVLLGQLLCVCPFPRFSLSSSTMKNNTLLHPIILVPGDGGSQLEVKVDKPSVAHYFCEQKTDDYFTLWINLADLVPFVIDCWVDNMRLVYDPETHRSYGPPGVDVRVPGFGNTSTVEYLDPSQVSITGYFNILVKEMVDYGYVRGVSIRGAPYDFRKSPGELHDYYSKLKTLIVETFQLNNKRRVILICHSLGCPTMLYFLNRQSQSWKDRYIKSLVALGGPWGGAVKALKAFTSGDNLGVIMVPALKIRKEERTFPSLAYLLPSAKFWSPNETLITTGRKNYTVSTFQEFFNDINYTLGYHMWLDTKDLTHDMIPPGVEVHCIHGLGTKTMGLLEYNGEKFPNQEPSIQMEDGDGTVNLRSLKGCTQWIGKQPHNVHYMSLNKVDHMSVMTDPGILSYIKLIAEYKPDKETNTSDSLWDKITSVWESLVG